VCATVDELLNVPGVDIVDIAVPARYNPQLSAQVLAAGKHVLVQKPMAETAGEAEQMVAQASASKRKLAVNHQMRWAPGIRAAADLLRRNLFGEVAEFSIQTHIRTHWGSWPWLRQHPYPELYYHSIHYLDTVRGWMGDPERVYATLSSFPGSGCDGPTRSYIMLEYPGILRGVLTAYHHSVAPDDDLSARFTFEGADGRCEGLIGLLLNYPAGRSDLLTYSHRDLTPGGCIRLELSGRWFPDAFIGPMSSLMDAVTNDTEPETSGQEILGTLRLVEAVRRSHESHQVMALR
jgi:predicted dehydrogenase